MRKRIWLWALAGLLGLGLPVRAAGDWDIRSFAVDVQIREDGGITVTEELDVDFTRERHRGIFRTIPVQYEDRYANPFHLRLEVREVTDGQGTPHRYRQDREGRYLRLKIGDPKVWRQEVVHYRIVYTVRRALNTFYDYDELYWNATGNEWPVPIRSASCTVRLPAAVAADDLRARGFVGRHGTDDANVEITKTEDGAVYLAGRSLGPGEGLTVVMGWPPGVVTLPGGGQKAAWFLLDNWALFLPLLAFGFLFWHWQQAGRDPRGRGAVVVQYEPPEGMTPAEAGVIVDEKVDLRDLSASIIDLAVQGHLSIEEITEEGLLLDKTDYRLTRRTPAPPPRELRSYERKLLDGLFDDGKKTVLLSDLKNKFYVHLPEIRKALYGEMVRRKWFPQRPDRVRTLYLGLGGAVLVLAGVCFVLGQAGVVPRWSPFSPAGAIAVALCGVLVFCFAPAMPRKTRRGKWAHEHILGLEEYLERAEVERLEAAERQQVFERLLPFAMALGVVGLWARAFEGLGLAPPTWYVASHGRFSPVRFSSRLETTSSQMHSTMASVPRSSGAAGGRSGFSSGGGFSGGGFGGGGGGAW